MQDRSPLHSLSPPPPPSGEVDDSRVLSTSSMPVLVSLFLLPQDPGDRAEVRSQGEQCSRQGRPGVRPMDWRKRSVVGGGSKVMKVKCQGNWDKDRSESGRLGMGMPQGQGSGLGRGSGWAW